MKTNKEIFSENCDFSLTRACNKLNISHKEMSKIIQFDCDITPESKYRNFLRWAKNTNNAPYWVVQRVKEFLEANKDEV